MIDFVGVRDEEARRGSVGERQETGKKKTGRSPHLSTESSWFYSSIIDTSTLIIRTNVHPSRQRVYRVGEKGVDEVWRMIICRERDPAERGMSSESRGMTLQQKRPGSSSVVVHRRGVIRGIEATMNQTIT